MASLRLFRSPVVLSIALVLFVFSVDLALPLGVAGAVPYTFAVLLALSAKARWFAPTLAAVCCFLTLLKMELVPDRGTTELWKVITNRCLALFAISMTTLLGILRKRAEHRRKFAEQQLEEQQATLMRLGRFSLLGQVAAGLAHELNQPLSAVRLHADLARRHLETMPDLPTEARESLVEIAEQSGRAAEIIKSIRRLAGRTPAKQERVLLNEVIHVVCRLMQSASERAGVKLEVELSEPSVVLLGDSVQLEQVLMNLIQNGIDAVTESSAGSRSVFVRTQVNGDCAELIVEDTGPGVVNVDEIFEPFYTTKADGLGLGLAICRRILDAHAGQIRVMSSPGRGTVITVQLPLPQVEAR